MASENKNQNFIEEIITKDLENGTVKGVITRFPPEPNGYLPVSYTHLQSVAGDKQQAYVPEMAHRQTGGKTYLGMPDSGRRVCRAGIYFWQLRVSRSGSVSYTHLHRGAPTVCQANRKDRLRPL